MGPISKAARSPPKQFYSEHTGLCSRMHIAYLQVELAIDACWEVVPVPGRNIESFFLEFPQLSPTIENKLILQNDHKSPN